MPFNTSGFKSYADLLAQINAEHQQRAAMAATGDGGSTQDANGFSTKIGNQFFNANYAPGGTDPSVISGHGENGDPMDYRLGANADGSIGQQSFSPSNDYKLFGGALAATLGPLAYGGAFGGAASGSGGGLFSNAQLGLDAQGFATNGLAQLSAGAPTAAEAASGVLTTTGAAGAAGGAGGAAGLTAAQIAAGVGAAGTAASLANGSNMPDTSGVHFSDAGYGAQNGIDPTYTGSGTATSGLPEWVKTAQQALQLGSGVNGLLSSFNGLGGAKQAGNLTNTTASQIDPRMQNMLYGDGTAANTGALGRILSAGSAPRTAGTAAFGQGIDSYLQQYGRPQFDATMNSAAGLQNSHLAAPQMNAASVADTPGMKAAQINAPNQNGLDLSGSFDRMINGNAGANPYLTSALQSAVNQTNASYDRNATNLTNNLQRNILPGIGDQAFASGQYGGSRQGIAQGNAISDYTNQLSNSNLQLGLANSANTTGQQANAFNQGQDRSLSAMNNLSGQQYGTATNNAQMQQQANSTNYAGQLQSNLANAGYQNSANANNQQAGLSTNSLNSQNQISGTQLTGGLLTTANSLGQANNNYDLNRATQTAGGLGAFTGLNNTTTDSKPLYTNPAGNFAAAATGIGGLLNQGNDLYNSGSKLFSNIFG